MLVYGDSIERVTLHQALAALRTHLRRALRARAPDLDALRALLILSGELEQALLDDDAPALAPHASALTACVAEAFVAGWLACNEPALAAGDAHAALHAAAKHLDALARARDMRCEVRVPEGFAYYTLYPEQYIEAALLWAAENATPSVREVLVVGIRSIGTTLAALVAAVLRARGFAVRSITTRPTGHPFLRRAQLPPNAIGAAHFGLVVDEGPGASGSSMYAVAEALVRAGIASQAISLLPGHAGLPGAAASCAVRAFWLRTPRYSVPLARVRLNGRVVPDALAIVLRDLYGPAASVAAIEDLSAGAWRSTLYDRREQWPAVCTTFERTKLRCTTRGGARYLLKFSGLGCSFGSERSSSDAHAAALAQRAALGFSPRAVACAHGFVVTRWVEGKPLDAAACSSAVLDVLGRYLARAAGPRLSPDDHAAALERMENMLSVNAQEALGAAAARRVREVFVQGLRDVRGDSPRTYGDGHLAPHEWLRTSAGELIKVDCSGHSDDHTIVGKQAVAWDIAAAALEWKLPGAALERMLIAYALAGGQSLSAASLTSYRLAYAAFRAGQCQLCASACNDDDLERDALLRAYSDYRAELCRVL